MKRFYFLLLTAFFLLSGLPQASASRARDEDIGFWLKTDAEKKLSEKLKMGLGEEMRFREHAGIGYSDSHAGVSWQACKYLLAGADFLGARQTRVVKKKDIWYWEARPRIFLTPQYSWKGWKLEDRNMLEFRVKEQIRDSLRYRQQIGLTAPWKWTRFEFQPYVTDEMFFESHRTGMTENRLAGGFKVHFYKALYGSIYYLRQSSKSSAGKWSDANIFGLQLRLAL